MLLLLPLFAPAQSTTDTVRTLPPVTIQSARFEQNGYTRWKPDSLPLSAAVSLADKLLWENPLALRANAPGTLATLSIRGAGPSRSPVFWNGLNLQSPMNGVVDASLLPLFPDDEVQVQLGGHSAALSNGCMGGSVQVSTNAAPPHPGWNTQAYLSAGSFGLTQTGGSIGHAQENRTSQLRANWQQADNDFPFRNTAQIGQPAARQPNNFQRRSDIQQFNRFIFRQKNVLRTALWHQSAWRQIPPAMTEARTETWQADRTSRAVLTWENRTHAQARWLTRLAAADEWIAFRYAGRTDTSRSRTWLVHSEWAQATAHAWLWKVGTQATFQSARVDGYADNKRWVAQHRAALFGMAERVFAAGRLSLLLRQEWWVGGAAPFTGTLGGQWSLGRGKWGVWSFHLARNFNLPTLNDRYWANLGKPDLRPESGYSGDVGWSLERGRLRTEVAVFQLLVDDWILWQPGPDGLFRPDNLRKVWSRGSEWRMHWTLPTTHAWVTKLTAHYQFVKATNTAVYGGNAEVLGRDLPYTPRHAGGLACAVRRRGWSGAYLHQITGARFVTADNQTRLQGFSTAQVLLEYGWVFPQKKAPAKRGVLRFSLRLENVWNAPYQVIQFRPMPGRSGVLGVAYGR